MMQRWQAVSFGIGAMVIVTIILVLVVSSDAQTGHSVNGLWVVVLLPIFGALSGAILLMGQDEQERRQ